MKTIIIVDDESLVRVGLQSIIPWEDYGYSVSGVYHNGREALDACMRAMPDAILTDIRMPVMDGLEFIKNVRQISPRVPIVILSSYDDFEYTRTAIKLGVQDYIQKHRLEPEELIRMLDGLKIEENGRGGEEERAISQQLKKEKEELIAAATRTAGPEGPVSPGAFRELEKQVAELGPYACWMTIRPIGPAWRDESLPPSYSFLVQEELERYRYTEYLGARGSVVHALFYAGEFPKGQMTLREHVLPFCENLLDTLRQKCNADFAIGIGRPGPLEEYEATYRGAGDALASLFYGDGDIALDAGAFVWMEYTEEQWLDLYKTLKKYVQQEKFAELLAWLDDLPSSESGLLRPRDWLRIGGMLATQTTDFLIEHYALDVDKIKQHFGDLWPLERHIGWPQRKSGWIAAIRLVFERTNALIASVRTNKAWLVKIKAYVNERYAEPIRLEAAAAHVYWSENYFSQRFSQETGMTFLEYVAGVRIAAAKELLKSGDRSTEDIAATVGYVNANYFVKVFKKTTGLTVSEFKAQHKS
ncbi:response regulator transcription factor [Cohnella phaseoli]|uniref:YesN/AraC family two-component response regulator n=1 Tax=Cohnella phaseoli TaxID=456490 RepID=A0A3D9I871_9BACL|nr:response regulator [Cohnella phaseoli]RED57952.1 YesN/AraC family two-component response regulator [Cohnella phaseoli]